MIVKVWRRFWTWWGHDPYPPLFVPVIFLLAVAVFCLVQVART